MRGIIVALTLLPLAAFAQDPQGIGQAVAPPPTAPPPPAPLVVTKMVQPEYSPEARAAGLQGSVVLAVDVAADGAVADARVRRGLGLGLDERAVAAVKQWQYESGRAGHDAVQIDFALDPPLRWEFDGAAFMRAESRGPRSAHPMLTQYTSPDPAACPDNQANVIVSLRILDDGTPSEVHAPGTPYSAIGAAAEKAVEAWRFLPIPVQAPGVTRGTVFLQCKASATDVSDVFKVGGGVSQPSVIFKLDPEYSVEARRAKYSGTVLLQVVVTASGRPANIRVVRSLGLGLDEEAVLAVGQWRFRPGMKAGQPVNVRATIEVNFKLL